MDRSAILFLCLSTLFSCQSGQKEQKAGQAAAKPPAGEKLYPSIPLDTLQMLWDQCDYIDYVFYYQDFTVSQNQQADIQNAIRYISEAAPEILPGCQPIGRIFYQVRGDNRLEAELHFSQGCTYFIFYENGKKAYANAIMPAGIQFINQIMSAGASPPAGQ